MPKRISVLIFILQICGLPAAVAEFQVEILETQILNQIEESGYSLSEVLGDKKKASKTSELYQTNSWYRSFADQIGKPLNVDPVTDQLPQVLPPNSGDVPEMVRMLRNFEDKGARSEKDLKGGYFIRHLSNNSQYPYAIEHDGDEPRHFDPRWLNSPFAYFKLIAVMNRMDRRDFDPDSCGEVRFIYRLSYQSSKSSSSLPFFVNVVNRYPKKESCAELARRWQIPLNAKTLFQDLSFKQLEVNFQSLRFTSGYMHDFGGQAMYFLRIFRKNKDRLTSIPLENTPDVLAIEKKPELLKRFVEYLKSDDHLQKLDQGHLVIDFDPEFLTSLAVSWSTSGRARSANKPYSRLFQNKKDMLKQIDYKNLKFIKSPEALIERLNNLTCMGCHQSSGTAGFHMLGKADPQFSHGFNRQELAFSPHTFADLFRRKKYVQAVAQEQKPDSFKPHSNFPTTGALSVGQLCLLEQKHFAVTPVCDTGLQCQKTVSSSSQDVLFGECVKTVKPVAGSACWQGEVIENQNLPVDRGEIPAYNLFSFQDKWKLKGALPGNPNYKCVLPQSGAPLGRSSRPCTLQEENFSNMKSQPLEICGNQGGNGFDLCAATGDSGSCLEARVVRSMLDTCSPGHFCREDYICQKIPDYSQIQEAHYTTKKNGKKVNQSTPKQINQKWIQGAYQESLGFCVPTYFLFNMRLDGHPSPITGLPPGEPKVDRSQPLRGYQ